MAWPDIVSLVIPYLDGLSSLDGVTVASKVPNPRPPRLLQVRRVGGTKAPPVRDRGRLDFINWADTEPQAMADALAVRTGINALWGTSLSGVVIYRIEEFLGPRQFDDPVTGTPRVLQTQTLLFRADEAIR